MDVARVARIVALMFSPTLIIGAGIYIPKIVSARLRARRDREAPIRPPIERLAADLRRMLARYDAVRSSPQLAMRAHHLQALEAAIADCAATAADELGVPHPARPTRGRLPAADLQQLLRALAEAGLAIPSSLRWLAADG